ncbi:MAG: sigma-70 family RNA polymerase sigma factor [Fuerstiella sp.]
MEEHHMQLRSFVRTLGVDPDWVDDLAQEAFLVAFREKASFDRSRDIGKWLRGIARNLVRNEIRKDARRRRILHEALAELLVSCEDQCHESAHWTEMKMPALRDCVEQLPSKSRQLVSERYGGGWLADEMAEQLRMSASAIRMGLTRIRRQLKQCIEQKAVEEGT